MKFGVTLGKHLMMTASANILYVAIDYKVALPLYLGLSFMY